MLGPPSDRASDRVTTDADFLVSWEPGLVEAIREDGWEVRIAADPGDPPHLIRARRADEAVDFLVALTHYQQEALRRATDHVLTVEDVVVHKVIAWRERDREDIQSILEAGHEIDWDYVSEWVEYFGFEERLKQLPSG